MAESWNAKATAAPYAPDTLMRREALEAGGVVARMLAANHDKFVALAEQLRSNSPDVVVTCARGSSDHAATYGKYLIESLIGVPVATVAPSVSSLFNAPVTTGRALCVGISQSGRSPDILSAIAAYRDAGAPIVAAVNDEESPLALEADVLIALSAGPERSVAATKSCIAAMAALAAIVAAWSEDAALTDALSRLPEDLDVAVRRDWSAALQPLATAQQMLVIGRGFSFGIAQECALKLKETCQIQAESFSSAEVRHGPMAVVREGFPVLALATSDVAGDDVMDVAATFADRGAKVLIAHAGELGTPLPAAATHPAIEPILMLASFYGMVEELSRRRGLDPDRPPHLAKVTRTR